MRMPRRGVIGQARRRLSPRDPFGRLGEPADLPAAILFSLAMTQLYITGQVISVLGWSTGGQR